MKIELKKFPRPWRFSNSDKLSYLDHGKTYTHYIKEPRREIVIYSSDYIECEGEERIIEKYKSMRISAVDLINGKLLIGYMKSGMRFRKMIWKFMMGEEQMNKNKRMAAISIALMIFSAILTGCGSEASVVSQNLSKDADEFRIIRRVVFYNSITDTYILEMVGNISINIDSADGQLEVTAKIGPDQYQKHYLGLSDNVTYTVEQLGTADVDPYKYKLIFKPQSIIPIELEYKAGEEPMEGKE